MRPFESRLIIVAALAVALLVPALAAAQSAARPSLYLGSGIILFFDNVVEDGVGKTRLVLGDEVAMDTRLDGTYVLTLEQGGAALATGTCETRRYDALLHISGDCNTTFVPSSSIRVDRPVDVVLAHVNTTTDARTEVYRGTFPVFAFTTETTDFMDNHTHLEQRGLRLDSLYGAAFVEHAADNRNVRFTYLDTRDDAGTDVAVRCRVGSGEWRAYPTSIRRVAVQTARNRVWVGEELHDETLLMQYQQFALQMPIDVQGSGQRPSGGASMDGAWTCELRAQSGAERVVLRELRFEVRGGLIQPTAIDARVGATGRGGVLVAASASAQNMPVVFDPAVVRDSFAGVRLTGTTSPYFGPMPARATNPTFTEPPRRAQAGSGRGGRRR